MGEITQLAGREEFKTIGEVDQAKSETSTPKSHEIARGTVIGRYKVLERLGSGDSATVYSAYDGQVERIVALKVLRAELEADVRAERMRKAQAMMQLNHPHVVTVYDVGTFGARIYIAMEFVDGSTLRRWIRKARPWREVLEVLKAAGRGLAAAHDAGFVHRDFKPDNVLVGKDGRILVADFGISHPAITAGEQSSQAPPEPPSPTQVSTAVAPPAAGMSAPPIGDDADATVAAKRNSRKPPKGKESDAPPAVAEDAETRTKPEPSDSEEDENPTLALNLSAIKAAVAAELQSSGESDSSSGDATRAASPSLAEEDGAKNAADGSDRAGDPALSATTANDAPNDGSDSAQLAGDDEAPTMALKVDDVKAAVAVELKKGATAEVGSDSKSSPAAAPSASDDSSGDDEAPTMALKLDDVRAAVAAESRRNADLAETDRTADTASQRAPAIQGAKERASHPSPMRKPDARTTGPRPGPLETSSRRPPTQAEHDIAGTAGFVAPEHLASGEADARSDQFSFAVTMYVALYGQQPFRFRNLSSYREAVQRPPESPPPSQVPRWIHTVIARGLRRNPEQRFSTMTALLEALDRDPSRQRSTWTIGAAAAAAAVAGIVFFGQHRADLKKRSQEGVALMASTWNPQVEQRTRTALTKAGGAHGAEIADHVVARLSDYAATWASSHRKIAEATLLRSEQDTATMSRRTRCLERARDQLSALTAILSQADRSVRDHSVDAVFALPAADPCASADIATLPAVPTNPQRTRVIAGEHAVAEAKARASVGDDRGVEAVLARALPDVRALPLPRIEAELLLIESDSRQHHGEPQNALSAAEGAFHAAQHVPDDALAARAAARVAYLLGARLDRAIEGERWMKAAEAIADRAGRDDALEASLLASRIPLNALLGFADRNPALHDQEVAVLTRLYGDRDPRVARAFSDRGLTHYLLGKLDPALVDVQQAIALAAAVAGPGNPHLARDYIYLGAVQHARGQLKESRDAYDRARALQVDGPLELALAQYTLAKSLRGAGRDASRAREMAEQTRDELRKMPTLNKELAAVESWLIEGSGQNAAPSP